MTAIAEPRTAAPLAPSATRARERSRLLVATAGEPDSRGALRTAAALTQRDDAEVMALGVAMPFPNRLGSFASMKSPVMIDDERRCAVLSRIQRSTQRLPAAAEWTKQAAVGMPAETINEVAASWRASMIVLGIGRHTRLDRVFGSETAVAVMRRARIPVLAVPPSTRQLPRHVLVAMDFTGASVAAADVAAAVMDATGVITVAHVCAFGGVDYREGDLVDIYRAGARAKLDQTARELRARTGRCVETAMLEGAPAEALLDYARREHCDLIALGGHEQGLMDRILLGSVRTAVVRGARCGVLIAPPAAPR